GITLGLELGPEKRLLSEMLGEELWRAAGAELVEVSRAEFAEALETIGLRDNYGLDSEKHANERQREVFWRALHLEELVLARGCALGRESAWRRFLAQYREPLIRAAVDMTGLTAREGQRWSPLLGYSGRGSLMGWLRAILAQRRVNLYRKTGRETELGEIELAAVVSETPDLERVEDLRLAIKKTLSEASAEERFLLSAYYLDEHTLHEISRVLRVHEATISRKLKRATERLRKELLRILRARGLSRRAAEEALGTDPRDVDINLRKLLQKSDGEPICDQDGQAWGGVSSPRYNDTLTSLVCSLRVRLPLGSRSEC